MRLLLMDVLRRRKWFYLIVSLYFITASSTSPFASVGMGLSIGAMLSIALESREVLYLPISRKQIWRTRWVLALVPITLSAVIRPLVLGIRMGISYKASGSPSWFLPSSAFQMIYVGSLFAAYIPISHYLPKFVSPVKRLLASAALVLAAIILGAIIEERLPKHWYELTSGTSFLFAIGLFLTLISFFYTPRIVPRRVTPMPVFGDAFGRSPSAGKPDLKTRYMRTGHTSLKLLVWRQIRSTLFVSSLCGFASQLPVLIGGWWGPGVTLMLERGSFFFDPLPTASTFFFVTPIFFASMWVFMAPDVLGLRHLRTLPVTTRALAAMLTIIPMLFWLTFWAFPLATYWLLAGHPPSTLRLDLLAALTGLTCLASSAATHAWVKGPAQITLLPMLSIAGISALHFYGVPLNMTVTSLIGIFGCIAVAVSFVLNDRALRLNGTAYTSKLRLLGYGRPRWIVQ